MVKRVKKSVEDYLNEISYDDDGVYIPSDFAIQFMIFIQLCNDGVMENKSPMLHYKVVDKFDNGSRKVINLMHRGLAKTTLIRYLFFFIAAYGGLPTFGRIELALYVSDSIENGVKNMRKNLEFQYKNSTFLKTLIPQAHFTDINWEFTNSEGKQFIIKGFGAKTGVRGVTALNSRPKLAVLDDILSDSDARSATVIADIEDTVHKAIGYAMHPIHKLIWNGTPFNASDPLYKTVEAGTWEVNVYPVCEQFPVPRDEFRGSWEDRFTYDIIKKNYDDAVAENNLAAFNQELMLRIMSDDDRMIPDECIQYYDISFHDHLALLGNIYMTTDFATSEKQHADFSGINVWAYMGNGDWYWLDGECKRQTMDKNINTLFRFAEQYCPISVGIEISGQQGGFIPWIKQEMLRRNLFFTLASNNNRGQEGIRPTTDKMQRFNVVVPLFKNNKMYFPKPEQANSYALDEMLSQVRLVSNTGFKSRNDDQLDNISQLALLNAYKPSMGSSKIAQKQSSPFLQATSGTSESPNNTYFV